MMVLNMIMMIIMIMTKKIMTMWNNKAGARAALGTTFLHWLFLMTWAPTFFHFIWWSMMMMLMILMMTMTNLKMIIGTCERFFTGFFRPLGDLALIIQLLIIIKIMTSTLSPIAQLYEIFPCSKLILSSCSYQYSISDCSNPTQWIIFIDYSFDTKLSRLTIVADAQISNFHICQKIASFFPTEMAVHIRIFKPEVIARTSLCRPPSAAGRLKITKSSLPESFIKVFKSILDVRN